MTPLLLAVAALAADPAATERQYRRIALADGRVLVGEILATRPEGLSVATPQGELSLSYELLLDMTPSDAAAYAGQEPWLVLLPEAPDSPLAKSLSTIPSVVVWTPAGVVGDASKVDLSETEQTALRGCKGVPTCMKGALGATAGWRWIVTEVGGGESEAAHVLHGAVSSGDTTTTAIIADRTDTALWVASHQVLGLLPPQVQAPALAAGPRREGGSSSLTFAPLPGLPALAAGDGGRFALALGIALPATAAWVGVVGTHAESLPEHAALGAAGFYAITVLTNELLAPDATARERRADRR